MCRLGPSSSLLVFWAKSKTQSLQIKAKNTFSEETFPFIDNSHLLGQPKDIVVEDWAFLRTQKSHRRRESGFVVTSVIIKQGNKQKRPNTSLDQASYKEAQVLTRTDCVLRTVLGPSDSRKPFSFSLSVLSVAAGTSVEILGSRFPLQPFHIMLQWPTLLCTICPTAAGHSHKSVCT